MVKPIDNAVEAYKKMLKHEALSQYYNARLRLLINTGDVNMDQYYKITDRLERNIDEDIVYKENLGELQESTVRNYIGKALK